jgi:hypothetical protein
VRILAIMCVFIRCAICAFISVVAFPEGQGINQFGNVHHRGAIRLGGFECLLKAFLEAKPIGHHEICAYQRGDLLGGWCEIVRVSTYRHQCDGICPTARGDVTDNITEDGGGAHHGKSI